MIKKREYDLMMRCNNYCTSPFLERLLERVSDEAGRNRNNQISKSHGIQVLVLRYAQSIGIETKRLYPTIKH